MHCVSTRDLAALAYERGEEFDPELMPTPELMDQMGTAMGAMPLTCEPGSYERRRRRERERERRMPARVRAAFVVTVLFCESNGRPWVAADADVDAPMDRARGSR